MQQPQQQQGKGGQVGDGSKVVEGIGLTLTWFWWLLTFAAWVVALGGVSAMQNYCTDKPQNINQAQYVFSWDVSAAFPRIPCGKVFRFEWWAIWLTFIILILTFLALVSKAFRSAKVMLVGFLATSIAVNTVACANVNNVLDTVGKNLANMRGGRLKTATRVAFAGFIMVTALEYALLYMIGVL